MSCLQQDGTGDLQLTLVNGAKRLSIVQDVSQCAAQKLTNRFLLWKGEWFLDTRQGFPYFQFLTSKNPDRRVLTQLFSKVVLSVPGIQKILSLTVNITPSRHCQVGLVATTDEGATIVGGPGNAFIVQ